MLRGGGGVGDGRGGRSWPLRRKLSSGCLSVVSPNVWYKCCAGILVFVAGRGRPAGLENDAGGSFVFLVYCEFVAVISAFSFYATTMLCCYGAPAPYPPQPHPDDCFCEIGALCCVLYSTALGSLLLFYSVAFRPVQEQTNENIKQGLPGRPRLRLPWAC